MESPSLTIPFSAPAASREPVVALMLEQKPWRPYTGYLTKVGMVQALSNRLYSTAYDNLVDCGMDGDQMACTIYAYPYDPCLHYMLATSYGELSDREIDEFEYEELVNVSLDNEITLQYPAQEIISVDWEGEVWDVDGAVTQAPAYTVQDKIISLNRPVYGALRVKYRVNRHVYILTVEKRAESPENFFSAVVYGVYPGGITWLDIEPPAGAEEFAGVDATCGYGAGSVSIEDVSGPGSIPSGVWGDRVIKKDYCSQETISDVVNGL